MQFLWTYIDDIIGKGVDLFVMIELISYLSVSLFPTALPIAVLISSVMVMGDMAEKYELASLKSAGVPLIRIMLPLMFLCFGIAVFSFFCANNLAPVANLKFKSRLYDIRKQKPTLNLEEGVFNDDFKGFVIHIGKKEKDNRTIKDVLIYDHTTNSRGKTSQIIAKEGEMFLTEDKRYFIMKLYNGTQYQETNPSRGGKNRETSPFMRTSFKEWNKIFDLSQFELNRTNEDLFKTHQSMLTVSQLLTAIDSIEGKIEGRKTDLLKQISRYIYLLKEKEENDNSPRQLRQEVEQFKKGTDKPDFEKKTQIIVDSLSFPQDPQATVKELNTKNSRKFSNSNLNKFSGSSIQPVKQNFNRDSSYTSILESFPKDKKTKILRTSKGYIRNVHSQIISTESYMNRTGENLVKHIYQLHSKFSMALICFIFLFIGAPMGAIVRKGGFGYPILIAILFFILFIVLSIFFKKLAESFTISAAIAAWAPAGILFPIGLFLTTKAMNDSKILNVDKYVNYFKKIFKIADSQS